MALTERSWHKIYETFTTLIDDEQAVQEMLSYFPARDVEEPVTKEHLRAELLATRADLKADLAATRSELMGEIAELRTELKGDIAELSSEIAAVDAKIGSLRTELMGEITAVDANVASLRTELHVELRKLQTQMWTSAIAMASLIIAVLKLWN